MRFPPDVHQKLKEALEQSGRSFNAEVMHRLIASFDDSLIHLPPSMRERLAKSAKRNKRSMNSKINARLEASFAVDDPEGIEDTTSAVSVVVTDLFSKIKKPLVAKMVSRDLGVDEALEELLREFVVKKQINFRPTPTDPD